MSKPTLPTKLYKIMLAKGYNENLSRLICENLNTDYTAGRMIGYVCHYSDLPDAEIVDEMLAILSDRNAIMDKKQSQYAQSKISHMYRFGLGVEEDDDNDDE